MATKLAPFNPTSEKAIAAALEMAAVVPGDVVHDIGCGDGRLLVAAAQRGATAVGVEYDPVNASWTWNGQSFCVAQLMLARVCTFVRRYTPAERWRGRLRRASPTRSP